MKVRLTIGIMWRFGAYLRWLQMSCANLSRYLELEEFQIIKANTVS